MQTKTEICTFVSGLVRAADSSARVRSAASNCRGMKGQLAPVGGFCKRIAGPRGLCAAQRGVFFEPQITQMAQIRGRADTLSSDVSGSRAAQQELRPPE